MITNWNNKVLYTGVTNNLERRLFEHKNGTVEGFTKKYNVYSVSDKWLDNRTNKFVKEATEFYDNHEPNNVCKLFDEYVDEVSNWYIKVNRKKFWKSEMNDEKYSAYQSLYNALKTMLQVMAPIIPYMTDYVWIYDTYNQNPLYIFTGYAKIKNFFKKS